MSSSPALIRIEPPPEKTYSSHDDTEAALHAWTKSHGFNVSRRLARKNEKGETYIPNYECDRAGKLKPCSSKAWFQALRMRISIRALNKDNLEGEWTFFHTGNASALYNHKPSSDPRVHSAHRNRSAQAISSTNDISLQNLIEAQSVAVIPIANIYATMLQQASNALVIPKGIANAKNKARQRELATDTPMEALFKNLNNEGFFYRYTYDVNDPRVILHDREQALMNGLGSVFPKIPTICCRWHTNKNVLSKTREILGKISVLNPVRGRSKFQNTLATDKFMALFYRTVDSETGEALIENKAALVKMNPVLAAYLMKHWWKYVDKIVKVRINTSTVEGTHAQCKRLIKSTRGDLFTVFNKVGLLYDHYTRKIKS
ncbi:hypothetical protein PHMEG_0005041 [Phytophthora megakarya]|uniref:MULE transposase domain-containing protein n=1 Tax=Phytophthora megakarya TaxID=4795 RepID=A0A225WTX5_9STRA|nr:hypothetical protein PHMEG_0005041 [Phytophthora megakarya]